jgi:hypothetical protein
MSDLLGCGAYRFSGHGGRLSDAAYLLPFDSDRSAIETTAMATDELARELAALRARAVLLIFDCCHSGGLEAKDAKHLLPVRPSLPAEVHDALLQGRGWALFASSDVDELSYVRPGARNGIFTTHFLAGLRGEHGGNRHVRVFDFFEYLQSHVVREEPRQHPVFKCALRDNFAIALLPDTVSPMQSSPLERAVAAVPALRFAVRVGGVSSLLSDHRRPLPRRHHRDREWGIRDCGPVEPVHIVEQPQVSSGTIGGGSGTERQRDDQSTAA